MEGRMTVEQLLEALASSHTRDGGEGYTVSEMSAASGKTDEHIRKLVRPLIAAGRVRVSRKQIFAMDGRPMLVSSYVFIADEPAAPKRRR